MKKLIANKLLILFLLLLLMVTACAVPVDQEQQSHDNISNTIEEEQGQTRSENGLYGISILLRHSINQKAIGVPSPPVIATHTFHGDYGAPRNNGYFSYYLPDNSLVDPSTCSWVPPGVVFALKHNRNNNNHKITVFGHDATVSGNFSVFKKVFGGDLGAPARSGLYWYETDTNEFFDPNVLDKLPRGTIVCLKHTSNNPNKTLRWNGKHYDPADPYCLPPEGFTRMFGGDLGAPAYKGYYWYEKI